MRRAAVDFDVSALLNTKLVNHFTQAMKKFGGNPVAGENMHPLSMREYYEREEAHQYFKIHGQYPADYARTHTHSQHRR